MQLSKLNTLVVLLLMCQWVACSKQMTREEAKNQLAGEWMLVVKSDCENFGIRGDKLILHQDGRLEQHLEMTNAKTYVSSVDSKWSFLPRNSVSFDERFNVTKSNGEITVEKRHEILIVEFTNPPSILLNPDMNCFYQRHSTAANQK
jgi:hypothetical protein